MLFKRVLVIVGCVLLTSLFVTSLFSPTTTLFFICVAVGLLFLCVFKVDKNHRITIVFAISVGICGLIMYYTKTNIYVAPIRQLDGTAAVVEATVLDIIKEEGSSNGYLLQITDHNLLGVPNKFKVQLYSPVPLDVDYYDLIKTELKFFGITDTPLFDAVKYYQSKDISIFAYASGELMGRVSPQIKPPISFFRTLNDTLCQMIDLNLSKQAAGIVKAMLLGDKEGISDITTYQFSLTGIIHVVSVSGLHVSIVAGAVALLMRLVSKNKRLTSSISIILVWAFVALTGIQISAVRCALMFTIINLASLFYRQSDGLTSLFAAGIVIVAMNPFAINDMGFQLSFLSTLGIFVCVKPLSSAIIKKLALFSPVSRAIVECTAVSISVTAFCLPVLVLLTKGINPTTMLLNLIAIPATTIILFGGVLVIILIALAPWLAAYVILFLELIVKVLLSVTDFFARNESFFLGLDYPIVMKIIMITAICAGVTAAVWRSVNSVIEVVLVGAILIMAVPIGYKNTEVEFHTFNSYEGSVIVMIDDGKAAVISVFGDGYLGENISKFLSGKNIQKVEYLVLPKQSDILATDMRFLAETKQVNTVFAMSNANEGEPQYIKQVEQNNTVVSIAPTSVTYTLFDKTVVITSDSKVAQNTNCEFLFFYPKSEKQEKLFAAEYVILVGEYDFALKENMLDATGNTVVVSFGENSSGIKVG